MRIGALILSMGTVGLAGCAGSESQHGARTVFFNPYATLELSNGPIGPECEADVSRGRACYLDSLIYAGRGRYARDREGNLVRLTRQQRRILRERFERIEDRIERLEAMENATEAPAPSPPPFEPPATASTRTASPTAPGSDADQP